MSTMLMWKLTDRVIALEKKVEELEKIINKKEKK